VEYPDFLTFFFEQALLKHKISPPIAWMKFCISTCAKFTGDRIRFLMLPLPLAVPDLMPFFPCFLYGNATSTIPYQYAPRQKQAFEFCASKESRRGSHTYEINNWLWNFGRNPASNSVAKTQRISRKSRSEMSWRAWDTLQARKWRAAEADSEAST
jgi:hypothetical protein